MKGFKFRLIWPRGRRLVLGALKFGGFTRKEKRKKYLLIENYVLLGGTAKERNGDGAAAEQRTVQEGGLRYTSLSF